MININENDSNGGSNPGLPEVKQNDSLMKRNCTFDMRFQNLRKKITIMLNDSLDRESKEGAENSSNHDPSFL